jgi:hypothetical protein
LYSGIVILIWLVPIRAACEQADEIAPEREVLPALCPTRVRIVTRFPWAPASPHPRVAGLKTHRLGGAFEKGV